jgi:hypothetical protein
MTEPVRIVELVGPPGSGKTSLAEALLESIDSAHVESFPYFRDLRQLPFFVTNLVRLMPTLTAAMLGNGAGSVTKKDIVLMVILSGWSKGLKHAVSSNTKVIILEEGAICLLAKLYGFGSDTIQNQSFNSWWNKTYRDWANTLDLIVVLNAPTPTLIQRIRAREEQFEFHGMSDRDASCYLDKIQKTQESMIAALKATPTNPQILSFDTIEMQTHQIARAIGSFIQC